jgi:hypothetical protein
MNNYVVEISPQRAGELIEKIARYIVERHMAPAAIMTVESLRPLHSIGSQLMYFLLPVAEMIFDSKAYQEFAILIDNDDYVKLLLKRIDELDEEMHREERKKNRILRLRKRELRKQWFKKIFHK